MNVGGVLLLRFIGSLEHSAAAQAAYAVGYTELFSLITWTSVGLMGAAATIAGQNLGAGNPERAVDGVRVASRIGLGVAAVIGAMFLLIPGLPAGDLRHDRPVVLSTRRAAAAVPERLRALHHRGLSYTGGLQGTGDTRSPLYISIVSQVVVPLGLCTIFQATRGLAARRHLAGDRPRPHHARDAERRAVPPAEVAEHRRSTSSRPDLEWLVAMAERWVTVSATQQPSNPATQLPSYSAIQPPSMGVRSRYGFPT